MAAAHLPEPGSDLGPCVAACEHRDCASTREMAEAGCAICGDAIGYNRRFYRRDPADVGNPYDRGTLMRDSAGQYYLLVHEECA